MSILCLWHHDSQFLPVSTDQGCVHYFIFKLAFGESDRGAKTLGNSRKKTVQNKVMFCCDGTKERNQRTVGFLEAWDCPLPCLSHKDHIFDIQAASTNNVTDFPARIFSARHSQFWSWHSTSIWATLACLSLKWGPLPTLRLVGILHMACTARPQQSLWRPNCALLPAPGRVWFGAELVFLQDVSISRASMIS